MSSIRTSGRNKTGPKPKPLADRFWPKVAVADLDECWLWQASVGGNGYGFMGDGGGGRKISACHVSLMLDGRPRPAGLHALHSCDNRRCVNPRHLRWGTNADNIRDKVARGRQPGRGPSGERHPRAKITAKQAVEIRNSCEPLAVLSVRYGLSESSISAIRLGKTWKHAEQEGSKCPE